MAKVKEWVVDSSATRHIYTNKNAFISYILVGEGEEHVYLGDCRIVNVIGKGKVLLKFTFSKTLAFTEVLHVPHMRANLISVVLLGKVRVKVSFESNKFILTKNSAFMGKGY